ncbi:MAG TPA: hypothetical protein VFN51_03400 [Candidatus Saccharimonadales bacterium]|nr:hypothetical protein [Candidatus Saccharimonadales bacterium]
MAAKEAVTLDPYLVTFGAQEGYQFTELRPDTLKESMLRRLGSSAVNIITRNKVAELMNADFQGVVGIFAQTSQAKQYTDFVAREYYIPLDFNNPTYASTVLDPSTQGPNVFVHYQREREHNGSGNVVQQLDIHKIIPPFGEPRQPTYSLRSVAYGNVEIPVRSYRNGIPGVEFTPAENVKLNDNFINLHRFTKRLYEALMHKQHEDMLCTEYQPIDRSHRGLAANL